MPRKPTKLITNQNHTMINSGIFYLNQWFANMVLAN